MKKFMDEDFLLDNDTAKTLFNNYAKDMPIFDYHCHLIPQEIWENKQFKNITEAWLKGDHYKWRQMRTLGIDEDLITGNAPDYDKFLAYAKCIENLIGNPLYHWTHLELQRFFGIYEPLTVKSAPAIWEKANEFLAKAEFGARGLIEMSNVYAVCTTDDPADTLEYHKLIREEGKLKASVLPAMRPDKALGIEQPTFASYIDTLAKSADMTIHSYSALKDAMAKRIKFFDENGCKACDHAFNYIPYILADEQTLENVFKKALAGEVLTTEEIDIYKTDLIIFLAKEYKKYNWVMELHINASRSNNEKMFNKLGPDTGFDSVNDFNYAPALAKLLSAMDLNDNLPKTILFTLNQKDNYVLSTVIGSFQESGIEAKMQMGTAWWFFDHKVGMIEQMITLANTSVFSKFIGMVTDSRSFLSYPRHEYFRRILCNLLGTWIENGEYPADIEYVGKMVEDICFNNAKKYIGIK